LVDRKEFNSIYTFLPSSTFSGITSQNVLHHPHQNPTVSKLSDPPCGNFYHIPYKFKLFGDKPIKHTENSQESKGIWPKELRDF
jgi:hypothetical protein